MVILVVFRNIKQIKKQLKTIVQKIKIKNNLLFASGPLAASESLYSSSLCNTLRQWINHLENVDLVFLKKQTLGVVIDHHMEASR